MKLFQTYFLQVLKTVCVITFIFYTVTGKAQFTLGNVTLLQVGDGSSALVNTGNVIVLKEYSTAGILTYSMAVPSTGTHALVVSGSASSEGFLSLSADKKQLVFGGYARALPNSTVLPGATASIINRGVGMVGGSGLTSYSLVASSTSFFTGANMRGATAADKTNIWATGGSQGTNYFGSASPPVTVQNTKTNLRATAIFNGQLYCSSQVTTGIPGDIGVYAIGTGTPSNNGQLVSTVINTGAGSQPAQFYFNNTGTVCYVADQRNAAGGGIQKWILSAASWSLAYTLSTGAGLIGATGVVADFSGNNPVVYATTNESSSNRLISITDSGASSTATTLATANTAHTVFKGLAFSPCNTPVINASVSVASICENQTFTLNVSPVGNSALSYFWSGPGVITNPNAQNPVVVAQSSGIYTVTAGNACGIASATVNSIVNPQPAVSVNSVVICTGQTTTLIAGGANTYSWNTGSTAQFIVTTPSATMVYTVTGTAANGCTKTVTTQIAVSNAPLVSVNSATICSGNSATLMAGGANSFTWSNGATTYSTNVSPVATTCYTVSGSLSGCAGISFQTSTVTVLPTPVLTITGASLTCGGSAVTQTVNGAASYSWSFGPTTSTISVFPFVTTVYHVTGSNANGCSSAATSTISMISAPVLTLAANPAFICLGLDTSATLFALGASTYSWSNGATGSSVTITSPGVTSIYTVTGLLDQNCVSTAQLTVPVITCEVGTKSFSYEEALKIFPNPAHDQFALRFGTKANRFLALINSSGQLVYSTHTEEHNLIINLEGYAKGIYVISVTSNNIHKYKKLVID